MIKVIVLLKIFLIVSCAPETESFYYAKMSIGQPIYLTFSKQVCPDEAIETKRALTSFFISGTTQEIPLRSLNSNEFVSKITMGDDMEFNMYYEIGEYNKGKDYKTCQGIEKYEDSTYEDASRSIETQISTFQSTYKKVLDSLYLEKVKIKTAPTIIQKYKHKEKSKLYKVKEYLVNNAFYSRNENGEPYIVFLPQGYTKSSGYNFVPFNGVPLWKLPNVSIHEFGHHIFYEIIGFELDGEFHSEIKPCVEIQQFSSLSKEGSKRKVSKQLVVKALNEGFADLVASLNSPLSTEYKNITCMEKSRDVSSSEFANGQSKKLTENGLDIFLSKSTIEYDNCLRKTNFQDVHIIGAIFARHAHELMDKLKMTNEQKLKSLIRWAKNLEGPYSKSKNPKAFLAASVESLIPILKADYNVSSDTCREYLNHYPALTENFNATNVCE